MACSVTLIFFFLDIIIKNSYLAINVKNWPKNELFYVLYLVRAGVLHRTKFILRAELRGKMKLHVRSAPLRNVSADKTNQQSWAGYPEVLVYLDQYPAVSDYLAEYPISSRKKLDYLPENGYPVGKSRLSGKACQIIRPYLFNIRQEKIDPAQPQKLNTYVPKSQKEIRFFQS